MDVNLDGSLNLNVIPVSSFQFILHNLTFLKAKYPGMLNTCLFSYLFGFFDLFEIFPGYVTISSKGLQI